MASRLPLQIRRIGLNLVVVAIANGLALVTGPLLARGLGPAGRGALAAALLWPQVAYLIFSLGVTDAVTFYASRGDVSARAVRETAGRLAVWQSLAVWVAGVPVVYLAMHHFGHTDLLSSLLYLVAMPAELYGLYMLFLLNGIHRYRWFSTLQLLPFVTTAAGLAVLYVADALTVRSAVITNAVSWFLFAFATGIVARLSTAAEPATKTPGLARRLLAFGTRSWTSNVPHALNDQVDLLVISLALAPRQLGLYVIAATIATAPSFVGAAVANSVLPTVAAARGAHDRIVAARHSIVLTLVLTGVASVTVALVMTPLVRILFGHAFLGAVPAARVLVIATVMQAETRVFHGLLKGLGHPTDAAVSEAGALVVTAVGLAVLVPLIGIMGGAVTSLAAYTTSTLIAARYACVRLGTHPLALLRGATSQAGDRIAAPTAPAGRGPSATLRSVSSLVAGSRSAGSRVLAAVLLAGASLACGAGAWWGVSHPHYGLIIVMALIASLPFVIRGFQRRWDPFEPIHLVALGLLFMFVARPILELNEHLQAYAPTYNAAPGFNSAMIVGIVGTATLYAAYFSRLGSRIAGRVRSLPTDWDAPRSVRFTIGLLLVGALLTSMFVAQVGVHGYLQILSGRTAGNVATFRSSDGYFEAAAYVAIPGCLIALTAWRRQRSLASAIVAILCFLITLALTVQRGDRTFEIALFLPLIDIYFQHRNRRPRVWAIVAAFVVFTIGANASVALRNTETRAQSGVARTISSAITHPGQELAAFVRGADGSEFSVLEIEMHEYQTGVLHFWPGSTLASLATGWIPHSIYKSKPWSPLQHLTWTLFPATFGGGSFQPAMFGSFYVDSGWFSLVLLSALIGVALRAYWEYLMRHLNNLGVQLFFASSLPLVGMLLRADLSLVFAGAVFLSVPLVLCIVRCSRPPLRLRAGRKQYATVRA